MNMSVVILKTIIMKTLRKTMGAKKEYLKMFKNCCIITITGWCRHHNFLVLNLSLSQIIVSDKLAPIFNFKWIKCSYEMTVSTKVYKSVSSLLAIIQVLLNSEI